MPEQDNAPFRPPARQSSSARIVLVLLAAVLAAGVAWWFWGRPAQPVVPPPVAVAPATPAAPAPEPTGPQNPVDAVQPPDAALPALAASDPRVTDELTQLWGRGPVSSLLQLDGFVRRVVATVDNLPRAQVSARLWPVHPSAPRFLVERQGGEIQTIAPGNAGRYGALLSMAESVPVERLAQLYARLYPLFQQAYEELGYPRQYFNDRLVAVLDHLLQAPEPEGPLQVVLTEVKGEVPDPRPWVRYEFADAELQALSSGQKILVRMGLANERRAKTLLREFRRQVATGAVARK